MNLSSLSLLPFKALPKLICWVTILVSVGAFSAPRPPRSVSFLLSTSPDAAAEAPLPERSEALPDTSTSSPSELDEPLIIDESSSELDGPLRVPIGCDIVEEGDNNSNKIENKNESENKNKNENENENDTSLEQQQQQEYGDILILDHLNINHEQGQHDVLKAFYFDFLGCSVDPRKQENIDKGSGTIWANIGSQQFHLPEGNPHAQELRGFCTLVYQDLARLNEIYQDCLINDFSSLNALINSRTQFEVIPDFQNNQEILWVTDPWGSQFKLVQGTVEQDADNRGSQSGPPCTNGIGMKDLTIYTPIYCNLDGIGRFYTKLFNAPVLEQETFDGATCKIVISVGPKQTLTFQKYGGTGSNPYMHVDLRRDTEITEYRSNFGPHISMYVADLAACYEKAQELQVTYVNPRFKRRAFTLEEALDQCMFRVLNIVDPIDPDLKTILMLEHEIRSVVKTDGTMYKSCPFYEIPKEVKLKEE